MNAWLWQGQSKAVVTLNWRELRWWQASSSANCCSVVCNCRFRTHTHKVVAIRSKADVGDTVPQTHTHTHTHTHKPPCLSACYCFCVNPLSRGWYVWQNFLTCEYLLRRGNGALVQNTGMRRIRTFRSTTDRIYDGGPIIL